MPDSVRNNYANIMKALAWLSVKSIEIRQKAFEGKQKAEMADVEEENDERIICEDEEDTNIDIDSDDDEEYELGDDSDEDDFDHYDSPLDKIDEVLHFSNQLNNLQSAGGQELYNYLM